MAPAPTAPRWLRILLIAVAAIDTLTALPSLPAIFYDFGPQEPMVALAQTVNRAQIVIAPLLALAALWFAARRRLAPAIATLAAAMLVAWLAELPSVAMHGLEVTWDLHGMLLSARQLLYPVLAIAAIVLAMRGMNLPLAGVLVSVPTVLGMLGTLAFASAVLSGGGP
jgi:hypothetical protein